MHVRGVPRSRLGQSQRKFRVPGQGPDQLNRCEVAAESSLLTCSHSCSHISWYNAIGFLLPRDCTWITFWKNSHSQMWKKGTCRIDRYFFPSLARGAHAIFTWGSFFVLPNQNVLETMCARWYESIFQGKHSWAHGNEGADISYLNHMVLKTFQSGYGCTEITESRREKFGSLSL